MKTTLLILLLGLGALSQGAQPVTGEYLYKFAADQLPLYNLSGSFSTNLDGISESLTFELTPQGRIRGTFSGHYDDGAILIDLHGTLSGRLISSAPDLGVILSGRSPITGRAYGRPLHGSETFRASLQVDPATGIGLGVENVLVCLQGYGCRASSQDLRIPLWNPAQEPEAGAWSLLLAVTNRNNLLAGNAQISLMKGHTVSFRLRGNVYPRRQLVRMNLSGLGPALGTSLQLTADTNLVLQTMRGRLFGQSANQDFSAKSQLAP